MRKPKLRELGEAIKAVIRGPVTTKFPAVVEEPPDGFRGKPRFDAETCIGCKACAEVCPALAIEVHDDLTAEPPTRRLQLHYDRCIFCGHCALNCTTETGIALSKEYDLACFDRSTCVESNECELVVCEVCGALVGARRHLLYIAERLGAKQYANPTLVLLAEGEFGLTEPDPHRRNGDGRGNGTAHHDLRREDLVRVTCPRCRRDLVLRELWGES